MSNDKTYRPDIDGLRAVSIVAVVAFHAFPEAVPGGFVGVDVFFVISGFLITSIILGDLRKERFSVARFYERRIKRIFPALGATMAVCLAVGALVLLPVEYRQLGKHTTGGAFFSSNVLLLLESGYFDRGADTKPLLHLWSLAIEEQFYLFWPLLLAAAWRRAWGIGRTAVVVAVLSFAANVWSVRTHPADCFFLPFTRVWELMVGGMLAHVARTSPALLTRWPNVRAWAGVAMLAVALIALDGASAFPGFWALLPVVGAALLIGAGPNAWFNARILSHPAAVWVGLVSYPLYLWHWPALSLLRITAYGPSFGWLRVGAVALSVLLAWVTYRWIEAPIRHHPRKGRVVVTLSSAMAVLAAVGAGIYLSGGAPNRRVLGQVRPPLVEEEAPAPPPCRLAQPVSAAFADECRVHVGTPGGPRVVVWGDSYGDSWAPAFQKVCEARGQELFVVGKAGCPPVLDVVRGDGRWSQGICQDPGRKDAILADILALQPAVVVLASRWGVYTEGWIMDGVPQAASQLLAAPGSHGATPASSREVLRHALRRTVEALHERGIRVVVLRPPPQLHHYITDVRHTLAEIEPTLAEHRSFTRAADEIVDESGADDTFDPAPALCGEKCAASRGDVALYVDDNHLSLPAVLGFEKAIGDLLDRNMGAKPAAPAKPGP